MDLSSLNIKKNSYIFSKKSISYIYENGTMHFSVQVWELKEIHPEKISYISGNENPDGKFQSLKSN